jgi:hypothetical protein
MRVLYIEGVAIHDGPESCVGACEGAGEALTGVHVGRAIEPRHGCPGCRRCWKSGRQHRRRRYRESPRDPAGSKNLCMRGISMRENREVPCSLVRVITGRAAQATLRRYA